MYRDTEELNIAPPEPILNGALRRRSPDYRRNSSPPAGCYQVELIGHSTPFRRLMAQLATVSATDLTVLITGETGTGKSMVARALHQDSGRRDKPFIPVNCGGLPRTLVESELFGHEKGAFTGAVSRKIGRFEQAQGGTLLLDEIGDLPLEAQATLLEVLQEQTFQRVGGVTSKVADVRVVAATHRDVQGAMADGQFRTDLFYRLSAFTLHLPSLRQRREDIPALARCFVPGFARRLHRPAPTFSERALVLLQSYAWPGNVRELEHLVQRAVLLCKGNRIEPDDISLAMDRERPPAKSNGNGSVSPDQAGPGNGSVLPEIPPISTLHLSAAKAQFERFFIRQVMDLCQGNISAAARTMKVDRRSLQRKLKRWQIEVDHSGLEEIQ